MKKTILLSTFVIAFMQFCFSQDVKQVTVYGFVNGNAVAQETINETMKYAFEFSFPIPDKLISKSEKKESNAFFYERYGGYGNKFQFKVSCGGKVVKEATSVESGARRSQDKHAIIVYGEQSITNFLKNNTLTGNEEFIFEVWYDGALYAKTVLKLNPAGFFDYDGAICKMKAKGTFTDEAVIKEFTDFYSKKFETTVLKCYCYLDDWSIWRKNDLTQMKSLGFMVICRNKEGELYVHDIYGDKAFDGQTYGKFYNILPGISWLIPDVCLKAVQ